MPATGQHLVAGPINYICYTLYVGEIGVANEFIANRAWQFCYEAALINRIVFPLPVVASANELLQLVRLAAATCKMQLKIAHNHSLDLVQ